MNKIIILTSLIASLDIIDVTFFSLILPKLQTATKVNIDQSLWIQCSYFFCSAIMTLLLPLFTKYYSIRKILFSACFLYLLGTVSQVYCLQNYYLLICSRMLQGISVGMLNPASLIILNTNFKNQNFVTATSNYSLIIMALAVFFPSLYSSFIRFYGWQHAIIINIIYLIFNQSGV